MENGLVNLVNRMPEARFRHAIACVEDYSDFRFRIERRDVEVLAMHRSSAGVWRLRRDLFRLCRRLAPAIVHTRGPSGLDALLPARLAGVRCCVHSEHGWDASDPGGVRRKPALLRRLHAPLVDRFVAVSDQIGAYLVQRVGISPERITRIHNGVDTRRFAPPAQRETGILPPGFADRDSVVIGTIGRLQPVKDQATLIRAFAALVGSGEARARLAIVGDGPLGPELRQLVHALGLASRVWLPGAVSDVPAVLRAFDVFVLPSIFEGLSNTLLEAMATGVPVIATAVGGNLEAVIDGEAGALFEPGDVQRLAGLLARFTSDPVLLRERGLRARATVVERFELGRMVGEYQALYEALLSATARPSPAATADGGRADPAHMSDSHGIGN